MLDGWLSYFLLCVLCLKDALQAKVTSAEFNELKSSETLVYALLQDELGQYLFVMCHALYVPMCLLCLANQKVPSMYTLYFFILQSERMTKKWIGDAEGKNNLLAGGLKDIIEET